MKDLSSFQRDIVIVLSGIGPCNGVEVRRELNEYYETTIYTGRLYDNLDWLSDNGWAEKRVQNSPGNEYRLSDCGRRRLEAGLQWRHELSTDKRSAVCLPHH
jgi:DNA-binding PadR family transcriptional regulator